LVKYNLKQTSIKKLFFTQKESYRTFYEKSKNFSKKGLNFSINNFEEMSQKQIMKYFFSKLQKWLQYG